MLPQIAPFEFSHGEESVNSGETVATQCIILKGDSPLNFTWYLNGKVITPNDGVTITTLKRLSTMSIDFVDARHSGNYTCSTSNLAGTSSHVASLYVNGTHLNNFWFRFKLLYPKTHTFPVLPQIAPFEFSHGEESVNSGETVAVQCIILKGDSPLNFTWTLNGKIINSNEGITISTMKRISSLSIDFVEARHAGNYTCSSSNLAGTSSYSTSFYVKGTR